jgi:hypothetical protein
MIFTIELKGVRQYRFQIDKNWRRLDDGDQSLHDSDFRTSSPSEVMSRTPYGTEIEIEGTLYKVSPTVGQISEILYGSSTTFRREFPDSMPNKEQLRAVIASGDDEHANSLILRLDGNFELRQRPPFDINKNDPTVVLRYETFAPGNDYIGLEASRDESHINNLFRSSLEAWLIHLRTGETRAYSDMLPTESSEQLKNEIEALRSKWIAAH